MADAPTLAALYKAKAITEADLVAAVDAYLDDPVTGEFMIGDYTLDLAAAVLASTFATEMLARPNATEADNRNAVRTAILLATPIKMKGC